MANGNYFKGFSNNSENDVFGMGSNSNGIGTASYTSMASALNKAANDKEKLYKNAGEKVAAYINGATGRKTDIVSDLASALAKFDDKESVQILMWALATLAND